VPIGNSRHQPVKKSVFANAKFSSDPLKVWPVSGNKEKTDSALYIKCQRTVTFQQKTHIIYATDSLFQYKQTII